MQKLLSAPYLVLLIVLGSVTITTVLAQSVTITYPYILTDGTNQRLVIASNGNVGIGNTTTSPPGLLNVRQLVDNNLGGMVFQNSHATGSARLWVDSNNIAYLTGNIIDFNGGGVGIGTSSPIAKLDVRGNVALTGNVTATPAGEFKISTTNNKDICIGAC